MPKMHLEHPQYFQDDDYATTKIYILKKKIRGKGITYIDNQNDLYNFKDAIIDLTSNEIVGKDVAIKFDNSKFGNKNNQPRLKANSIYSGKNSTVLKKGVFTTCKKRDKCPPWVISADEIEHNKLKKTINYKNAWLKVYDVSDLKEQIFIPLHSYASHSLVGLFVVQYS